MKKGSSGRENKRESRNKSDNSFYQLLWKRADIFIHNGVTKGSRDEKINENREINRIIFVLIIMEKGR